MDPVPAKMRRLVLLLASRGWRTVDCGDGEPSAEDLMCGALDVPHVAVATTTAGFVAMADELYAFLRPLVLESDELLVEASYSPVVKEVSVVVFGIADSGINWDLAQLN